MVTVNELIEYHTKVCENARRLISIKGSDYSRITSHNNGDTLSNLRLPKELKIVKYNTQTVLTRLAEKYARLISLTVDPTINPEVKDETVSDTIEDCINFLVYLKVFYDEEHIIVEQDIDPVPLASPKFINGSEYSILNKLKNDKPPL